SPRVRFAYPGYATYATVARVRPKAAPGDRRIQSPRVRFAYPGYATYATVARVRPNAAPGTDAFKAPGALRLPGLRVTGRPRVHVPRPGARRRQARSSTLPLRPGCRLAAAACAMSARS